MKTILIIPCLLLLSFLTSYAQQTIKLNLLEGHEYVFEKIDRNYIITEDEKAMRVKTATKVFKITINKVNDDDINITLKFLENYREGGGYYRGMIDRVDFFYPEFKREKNYLMSSDFREYLYSKPEYKFNINLSTNKIELTNRVELLESFYEQLSSIKSRQKEGLIKSLNKSGLLEEQITFLTWFNNVKLKADNTLENSQLDDKLVVREKKNNQLGFGDKDPDEFISGKTYKKYWLETDNGLINNYSTIRYDSIMPKVFEYGMYQYRFRVDETNFRLLYSQKVPEETLFVSGKIEHPLSNTIHIRYLDKPFGVDLKTKTIILNEKGAFNVSIDYSKGGFIFVENENNNKYNPPGTYVFYAEPGDSINFNSTGKELPWETTVSGTKTAEANLLLDLRKKVKSTIKESNSPTSMARSTLILDNELNYEFEFINNKYVRSGNFDVLFLELDKIEKVASNHKTQLPERSYNFIINEVKAFFYSGIFNLSEVALRKPIFDDRLLSDNEDAFKYFPVLDELNLFDYYNDYGLYSRKLATHYLAYNFAKANKIRPMYITSTGWSYTGEADLKMQFARLVLTGAPYYREMASTYSDILIERHRIGGRVNRNAYMKEEALEGFDLMIKLCNDLEILEEAKHIVRQHKKLQNKTFLPEMELLNMDRETVTLKDFKGDKPTIFYLSSDWARGRYRYDDLAKNNPEYNFVMVLEGTSFKQWKEYTERAEPVAEHLLFLSDTSTFNDLFHKNSTIFVLNKNGDLEDYARSNQGALELAKASLQVKKKN